MRGSAIGLTPAERSLRSRIAAHAQHAAHDPKLTTVAARAARMRRFEEKVDPDGVLPPEERARRARSAFRAHMSRLSLKSAQIRRRRKEAGNGG